MCLIVAKPRGLSLPRNKQLKKWFQQNPDGFGIAFQYQGQVRLLKGAMTKREMFQLIERMRQLLAKDGLTIEDVDIVIQYRFAITGSICPKYCHPFPISEVQEELDSLDVVAEATLAHNGVIWEYATGSWKKAPKDINDAQEFIKDYLIEIGEGIYNPAIQKLVAEATMSKFAVLSNSGIDYIGGFIEDQGYYYSNPSYKEFKPSYGSPGTTVAKWKQGWDYSNWVDEQGWQYKETLEGLEEGGIVCDFCFTSVPIIYEIPEDEFSHVCLECFQALEGRLPNMNEVVY